MTDTPQARDTVEIDPAIAPMAFDVLEHALIASSDIAELTRTLCMEYRKLTGAHVVFLARSDGSGHHALGCDPERRDACWNHPWVQGFLAQAIRKEERQPLVTSDELGLPPPPESVPPGLAFLLPLHTPNGQLGFLLAVGVPTRERMTSLRRTLDPMLRTVAFVLENAFLRKELETHLSERTEALQVSLAEVERLSRFPEENPNPVMRISSDGQVEYANEAGKSLVRVIANDDATSLQTPWCSYAFTALESGVASQATIPVDDRLFAADFVPVRQYDYVNVYARDITETQALEAQLRQSQKLESIGTLAGGVAHEINNPIMGIMGYAQLIIDQSPEASPLRECADEIMRETDRVAALIKNLLGFARQEQQTHRPHHLCDIVRDTLSLIRTVLRHDHIRLDVSVPEDLPEVVCHAQQIQQVIMNLVTNARDAVNQKHGAGGQNKQIAIHADVIEQAGKQWVRTTIRDNGTGIPETVRERMFDPFFSTKPRHEGTGLGLCVSLKIVKDHGGTLTLDSTADRGTAAAMELPAADSGVTNRS